MSDKQTGLLSHYVSVFRVSDINRSKQFYRDKLGFDTIFEWGDPTDYAIIERDGVKIHLAQNELSPSVENNFRTIYIFSYDVDKIYRQLSSIDIEIINSIADRDYNMRDFDIRDPDGNVITFGCEIASVNT